MLPSKNYTFLHNKYKPILTYYPQTLTINIQEANFGKAHGKISDMIYQLASSVFYSLMVSQLAESLSVRKKKVTSNMTHHAILRIPYKPMILVLIYLDAIAGHGLRLLNLMHLIPSNLFARNGLQKRT